MPVPRGKDKRFPKAPKKLVLKRNGKAEAENAFHPDGKPTNFDYNVIETDYAQYAIIMSKTNLMVNEMFKNDLQFLWVLTRAPVRPRSAEWTKLHALAHKAELAFKN